MAMATLLRSVLVVFRYPCPPQRLPEARAQRVPESRGAVHRFQRTRERSWRHDRINTLNHASFTVYASFNMSFCVVVSPQALVWICMRDLFTVASIMTVCVLVTIFAGNGLLCPKQLPAADCALSV
jgi:hypothetical protein